MPMSFSNRFFHFVTPALAMLAIFTALTGSALAQPLPKVRWEPIAKDMTSPTGMVELPDESGRLLVVDQPGQIYVVHPDGGRRERPFLDIADSLEMHRDFDERGLLGLALHPDFNDNGRFFVYYSAPLRDQAPENYNHTSHISEFRLADGSPLRADPASERVLLQIDEPQFNHDGGTLAFGPDDGHLYISVGDGGGANDIGPGHPEGGNGQATDTLLGTILRIDVDPQGDQPYGIPEDNPFADDDRGRGEIYAYGLRNVWGMSFDEINGERVLFAADVGQHLYESVNLIQRGGNYGWPIREGSHCFDQDNPTQVPDDCPDLGPHGEPLQEPIIEYPSRKQHPKAPEAWGRSVTGGYVYRGQALPELAGHYVFADWSRSMNGDEPDGMALIASPPASGDPYDRWQERPLPSVNYPDGIIDGNVTAMGRDREGEIYMMTNDNIAPAGDTGKLYKLVPAE